MTNKTVTPQDISLETQGPFDNAFSGFFGKYEMEIVAYLIVKLLAANNEWLPFSYSDIRLLGLNAYPPESDESILEGFECLLENNWITYVGGRNYKVTDAFITRCKTKSDMKKQ